MPRKFYISLSCSSYQPLDMPPERLLPCTWQLRTAGSRGHPTACVTCILVLPFTFPALTTHLVVALTAKEHLHIQRYSLPWWKALQDPGQNEANATQGE